MLVEFQTKHQYIDFYCYKYVFEGKTGFVCCRNFPQVKNFSLLKKVFVQPLPIYKKILTIFQLYSILTKIQICGYGGIGRRARFRFLSQYWWCRFKSCYPHKKTLDFFKGFLFRISIFVKWFTTTKRGAVPLLLDICLFCTNNNFNINICWKQIFLI